VTCVTPRQSSDSPNTALFGQIRFVAQSTTSTSFLPRSTSTSFLHGGVQSTGLADGTNTASIRTNSLCRTLRAVRTVSEPSPVRYEQFLCRIHLKRNLSSSDRGGTVTGPDVARICTNRKERWNLSPDSRLPFHENELGSTLPHSHDFFWPTHQPSGAYSRHLPPCHRPTSSQYLSTHTFDLFFSQTRISSSSFVRTRSSTS
jgi:hypothetical protein